MTDYLCITLVSSPGETEAAFKSRLASFWTQLLRSRPDDYARVYAEATKYGMAQDRVSRQYMVEAGGADALLEDLKAKGIEFEEVDPDDAYSKYEAASPDWFQIPH